MSGYLRLLVCIQLLGRILGTSSVNAAEPESPPMVESSRGVLVREAYVRFIDRATLAFDRAGVIAELNGGEGDAVKESDAVVRLNDAPARATLAIITAQASSDVEVRVAKKEHETAEAEYQSVVRANEITPGTFPEPDVARLRLGAERTALLVEQRQHEHEIAQLTKTQAEAELATYSVPAPFAGIITNVFKRKGEAVQAGEQVIEIVNKNRIRIDGYIELIDSWHVQPGDPVVVRIVDPLEGDKSHEYRGTLGFVDVSVQTVRKNVRVWAEVGNPNAMLRDGLSAEMTIMAGINNGDGDRNESTQSERLPRKDGEKPEEESSKQP